MRSYRLQPALRALRAGGIIAYPTEAVYGLGCDPRCQAAVTRILALKGRTWSKGLILVASHIEQLTPYLKSVTPELWARAMRTWPGPVTWLWPASSQVPSWVRGRSRRVAVRVSAHPLVQSLCSRYGAALVSTSANHSGAEPARTARQVRSRFCDAVDQVLAAPVGGMSKPSEIRDLLSGAILRAGGG